MNLVKLLIPKENAQEVTEVESYKVAWKHNISLRWSDTTISYKCFIKKGEAEEFLKQLKECAKFIGSPIETELTKN